MKKRFLPLLLLLLLLTLLPVCGAQAGELHTSHGSLYWHGGIPEGMDLTAIPKSVDALEDYLVEQILLFEPEISVEHFGLDPDTFCSLFWLILNDHPELFFLHDSFSYYTSDNGDVSLIMPEYGSDNSDLRERVRVFNAEVDKVAAYADASTTQLGQLMLANDYLCANYTYDYTYTISDPERFFLEKTGVCQAYTMAFKAVLDRLGITSTSVYSRDMNHVWNLVRLDGSWYHLDVTWNDEDNQGNRPHSAKHNNFLLSDSAWANTGHSGWQTLRGQTASNTRYDDFFWQEIHVPIPVNGDTLYYVDQDYTGTDRTILAWQVGADYPYEVHTYSIRSDERTDCYSAGGYYPLCVQDSRLYYVVQHQIFSTGLGGGAPTLCYTLDIDGYNIYSMFLDGNRLNMWVTPAHTFSPWQSASTLLTAPTAIHLPKGNVELTAGQTVRLTTAFTPASAQVPVTWRSLDPSVATIAADGTVTGISTGYAYITASYGEVSNTCCVAVHSKTPLRLPAGIGTVSSEAFRATNAVDVIIPDGVTAIGPYAFADCPGLLMVRIPASVTSIDPTAFSGWQGGIILCETGSTACNFGWDHGLPVITVD